MILCEWRTKYLLQKRWIEQDKRWTKQIKKLKLSCGYEFQNLEDLKFLKTSGVFIKRQNDAEIYWKKKIPPKNTKENYDYDQKNCTALVVHDKSYRRNTLYKHIIKQSMNVVQYNNIIGINIQYESLEKH